MNNEHIKSRFTRWHSLLICLFLGLSTLMVYMPVVNFDFVNLDDDCYVYKNHYLHKGLTQKSIAWSFSFAEKNQTLTYWHPLTWLSHNLDCHLYGLNPGMHHLTSLIIHILNSILLFLLFKRMTGELWKSAFVAALFALHPINADSVAWVAERKNVLSTFFWLLTMMTYAVYCEKPGLSRYLLVCLVFVVGLLAKPMIVTLPCVLLLMDYWPLGRIRPLTKSSIFRGISEKIPLFLLSLVSVYVSTSSLKDIVPLISFEQRPLDLRIANALVSYVSYAAKIVWPNNLAVHYPYPTSILFWKYAGAATLLALFSVVFLIVLKRKPYLSTGWLWFIGTLAPVIGLRQVGLWPAMADRWMYVPAIGLFILITWGIPELLAKWRHKTKFLTGLSLIVLFALIPTTFTQVQHWENSISLFEHALEVTDNNYVAHSNLGFALANNGRENEAEKHYYASLKINPSNAYAHNNLGISLAKKNRVNEAIDHFKSAVLLNPRFSSAHYNLGQALVMQRKFGEAIKHLNEALRMDPTLFEAHYHLGNSLLTQGKTDEAIRHLLEALTINPAIGEIHIALGSALAAKGNIGKAVEHLKDGLELNPNAIEGYARLGSILANQGRFEEAAKYYNEALKINPGYAMAHHELGVLLAKQGKAGAAIKHFNEALKINPASEATHIALGAAMAIQGDKEKAITYLNEGLNDMTKARLMLGNILSQQGQYEEANFYYSEVLKVDPDNAEAYYQLGDMMRRQGKINEAIIHYSKALALKPDFRKTQQSLYETHYEIGTILLGKGEIKKAVTHFEKALQQNNNSAKAHMYLGYAMLAQDREDDAIEHCKEAIRIDPEKSVDAYYNLACIYARRNKTNESVLWLKKAVDKGFRDWNTLKTDKDLENIRNSSYYNKLILKEAS